MDKNMEQPIFETERLILSPVTASDVSDIFAYASDAEVAKHVTWSAHKSLEDSQKLLEWIGKMQNQTIGKLFFVWAIRLKSESGKMIGTIDFKQPDLHIGRIDYAMGRAYWNKGLMSEAALVVKNWSYKELPEMRRFESRAIVENVGSTRVMQKIGLVHEGTFRKILNNKGTLTDIACYADVR